MPSSVREPIQVYLTPTERDELDELAGRLGVSRSEVLRRGVKAMSGVQTSEPISALAAEGVLTPPRRGPGPPPVSRPVAPLSVVLEELAAHRDDR